jgi:CRP-like cAMP-binding protein
MDQIRPGYVIIHRPVPLDDVEAPISMQYLPIEKSEIFEALRSSSYFFDLSEAVAEKLALGVSLRRYERGEVLFWESDPCAGLHIIRKGSVKIFKVSPQGRELIINIFEDGATLNEVPVFDHGSNPVSVAALETTDVWIIDASVIHKVMEEHPEMCRAVIANLSKNLRMLVHKVEELSFYQVTNRLARLISLLPEEQLSGSQPYRITQNQLAAQLGTVREVVARSLSELQRSGAIKVHRRRIEILDEKALSNWAQCTPE